VTDAIDVPGSLELLDVAGNGQACERFLWIRGLSDPTIAPKSRIDVIDDIQRYPGTLHYLASRDGTTAATTFEIRDDADRGYCYLTIFARVDPGEPTLGDLVQFALDRAQASDLADVRCGDTADRPHIVALQERHGFTEFERWRRFHVDTANAPDTARLTEGALPADVRVATLAARPSLAAEAFRVYREALADTPGDFPRPEETLETWLREHDGSPVLGRDLVLLLLDDDDHVLAMVELERLAAGSDRAWVEFLAVDRAHRGRGLAKLAKRCAVQHARELRITRLQTMNNAGNEAICAINEQLGWTEDPVRIALRRAVAASGADDA
jgi:RimJ/RimL family protein N-acetyltransferase